MKKTIFWDFDGTLCQSPSIWSRSVYKILMETSPNCGASYEQIRKHMKSGFTWHTPECDYTALKDELWWEFHFRYFSETFQLFGVEKPVADQAVRKIRDEIINPNYYQLYPDTEGILKFSTQKGYQNMIISNNFPELEQIVDSLKIKNYFNEIVISAKVGYDKPRREIFGIALELAGFPEQCFMVGDNPVADIMGAKQCGIPTVLVHNKADSKADFCFERLIEMKNIL